MRYFIGFLVTIGLIILIIFLLLSSGGSKSPAIKPLNLLDYAGTPSTAQLIVDGPVVADQDHREAKITVSQNQITFTLYNGYPQTTVARSQTYSNNATAYAVFLQSLQHAGFTLHDISVPYDERGYCPTGERYILSFANAGTDLRRSWTTTCSNGAPSSFKGDLSTVLFLFRNQVPDYSLLLDGSNLY